MTLLHMVITLLDFALYIMRISPIQSAEIVSRVTYISIYGHHFA